MEGMLPEYALDGRVRQPVGAAIETAAPTNTYPCADGKWLCIAGNSDLIFRRLMAAIGRPELAARSALRHQRRPLRATSPSWTPRSPPGPRTLTAAEAEARAGGGRRALLAPLRHRATAPTIRISGPATW